MKIRKIFLTLLVFIMMTPTMASASVPYKTFTQNGYGYIRETQSAYTPEKTISKFGEYSFLSPSDIVITDDGYIYVADTGNKRILVGDLEGNFVDIIGEGELVTPTGIFVTDDKTLYVADKDGGKVVVFNEKGKKITEYGKPDHPLYGNKIEFKPQKLVVSSGGNMYIICEGNTNGIVQLSPVDGGTFIGYYGANYTSTNLLQIIQRLIFTDEQKAKMMSNLPPTPTNLSIDEQGLIYTVTQGDNDTLKKMNIAGNNLIETDVVDTLANAVTTGNYNNILFLSESGFVYELTSEGEFLFVFGGRDDGRGRVGLLGTPVGIDVDNNDNIYVLDNEKQQIHIYKPTEFTNYLHEALYLYGKGKYTESKAPLTEILEMNSLFDYANMAMGRALYQEEDYENALYYSRLSKDYDGYSDSFWEIRNKVIRDNLIVCLLILVLFFVVRSFLRKKKDDYKILININKKIESFKNIKLVRELRYSVYYMKKPFDGTYGIKRENKVSLLSTNIMLFLIILVSIISKYYTGFLLKTTIDGYYDLPGDIGKILIVVFVITICSYLMCTINDGESKLKDLYCGYIYSFTPYILFVPIAVIISNVVTYNEVFIVNFIYYITYVWVGILLFTTLKELNNYTFKETVKSIFLTIFTVLIVSLVVFILYVLFAQVFDFIVTLAGEVVYRFE